MANATFNLAEFKSQVLTKTNLARTNRFEMLILPPPRMVTKYPTLTTMARLVSIYVEKATFPPLLVNTEAFKIFGPEYLRPKHLVYDGKAGLNVTIHLDREMNVKRFFDAWSSLVVDWSTYAVNYQEDYISTIRLRQLDEQNNITYEVLFADAFPMQISQIEVDNDSTNQTMRLQVNFGYRYWRQVTEKTATDIPKSILNPGVNSNDTRTSGISSTALNV